MKYLFLILFLLNITISANCQGKTKLQQAQGVWMYYDIINDELNMTNDELIRKTYKIFKDHKLLTISYTNDTSLNFYFDEEIFGFINSNLDKVQEDFNIKELKDDGKYFISISNRNIGDNGFVMGAFCFVCNLYFEADAMVLYSHNESRYGKFYQLPTVALNLLYFRGKLDNRNYIKEYLGLDVRNVIVEKSIIYDSLEVKTKKYLVKNDLITVTGEQNSFLKMKYETDKGDIIEGLIKKENVQGIIEKKRIDVENEN